VFIIVVPHICHHHPPCLSLSLLSLSHCHPLHSSSSPAKQPHQLTFVTREGLYLSSRSHSFSFAYVPPTFICVRVHLCSCLSVFVFICVHVCLCSHSSTPAFGIVICCPCSFVSAVLSSPISIIINTTISSYEQSLAGRVVVLCNVASAAYLLQPCEQRLTAAAWGMGHGGSSGVSGGWAMSLSTNKILKRQTVS